MLYRKHYEEHYDIDDPRYVALLKINHPEAEVSGTFTELSSSSLVSGEISSKIGGESIQSSINSRKSKASSFDVFCLTFLFFLVSSQELKVEAGQL